MASNMVHKSPYALKGTDHDGNTERIVYKQTCRRDESMRMIPLSGRFLFACVFCLFFGTDFHLRISVKRYRMLYAIIVSYISR